MREFSHTPELRRLIKDYGKHGGALDYVFLRSQNQAPQLELHRAAAARGMAVIDHRLEQWARSQASSRHPFETFFRVRWDESKLTGEQVSFEAFWGTDDASLEPTGPGAWSIPNVDGYKTAFFLPPYSLRGSGQEHQQLFASINAIILGPDPRACEIYSWGTDWSNYFDAGKEWWGAFFWTIRQPDSDIFTVIGASTSD